MHPLLLRSTFVLAAALTAGTANLAFAQSAASQSDQKARCEQLIAYFDRYAGTGRSENSDGARNFGRIGAGIDCDRGQYDKGISAMEALLKNKGLDVPPASTGLANAPAASSTVTK
jgi:hypothetical protein